MKIAIVGPIATLDIAHLLGDAARAAPQGYAGAPLLATLIEGMLDRGHLVVGITTDPRISGLQERVTVRGSRLEMVYCPQRPRSFAVQNGRWGRALDLFSLERRHLREAIRLVEPDVVHAHWLYEFAWAALDAGPPCLITAHDSPRQVLRFSPTAYRAARYVMARWVAHRANRLTVVSPYMAREIRRITRVEPDVVPNPLPPLAEALSRDLSTRAGAGASDGPRFAMVTNGWGIRKNGLCALNAFTQMRGSFGAATLSLFGADCGPGEAAQRDAERHGFAKGVIFRGQLGHRELLESLAAHDVMLHPALEESFGMAIAEAMALGLPVIAGKDSGAVPWVVGDAGLLVDVRDPSAIAAAACELAGNPELRALLSRKARQEATERFSRDSLILRTESMYQDLLKSWPRFTGAAT